MREVDLLSRYDPVVAQSVMGNLDLSLTMYIFLLMYRTFKNMYIFF